MEKPAQKLLFDPPQEPEFLDTVEMDWRDFDKGKTNTMQRDTEAHARVATHLLKWHPKQAEAAQALLPDGTEIKLDAHTRCLIWSTGKAPPPPIPLRVDRWRVADEKMAGELKLIYDNRHATNQAHDVLFGMLRHLDVEFKSHVLRDNKFLGAIRVAENFLHPSREDIVDALLPAVQRWLRELRLFDSVMPTRKRFNTSLQAGSLLLLRRWGDAALPFLQAHQENLGDKQGTKFSAQNAFNTRYEELREQAAKRTKKPRDQEIVRLVIAAYLEVEADKWFEVGVTNLRMLPEKRFQAWLAEVREIGNGFSKK